MYLYRRVASKIAVFSFIALLSLSNTAFATNWVYLQRLEGTRYGSCTEYLDTDSVTKIDNKLTYWTIWVIDQDFKFHDIGKIMWKKEATITTPLRRHSLETYFYNRKNLETKRYLKPSDFYVEASNEIQRAFQYAQEISPNEVKRPDPDLIPTPKWYGYAGHEDGNIYWDIHSIAAWPQENPTTVEMMVKFVWNQEGLKKRKDYLMEQRAQLDEYENLSYTMIHYQFSTTENKVIVLSMADYDTQQNRISYFEEFKWKNIEKGSIAQFARNAALNWINNQDE